MTKQYGNTGPIRLIKGLFWACVLVLPSLLCAQDAAQGDFAGLVEIGDGRRLYLECHGTGSPTVILEAGFRNTAQVWTTSDAPHQAPVLPRVAEFTRVCAYDRPGTTWEADLFSRSDPAPEPRAMPEVVSDLHALLTAAQVPGPYVLAAHSLGGIMARMYAAAYPYSVIGLVLVDAYPENVAELLGPVNGPLFEKLVTSVPPELEGYKDLENFDIQATVQLMRETTGAKPLRPLPLIVLSRGRPIEDLPPDLPPYFPAAFEADWRAGQNQLAALLPDSQHFFAQKSGHYIPVMQPGLVVNAIRQVVRATREGLWP